MDAKSVSDHRYIQFQLHQELKVTDSIKLGKWVVKKFDEDWLKVSYLVLTWEKEQEVYLRMAKETAKELTWLISVAAQCPDMRSTEGKRNDILVY